MNDFKEGDEVWWLFYNEEYETNKHIYAECIGVQASFVKRVWKNGNVALTNGLVFYDSELYKSREEVMKYLIKHVEALDSNIEMK